MTSLAFDETTPNLQTRIEAHRQFGAFDLNAWARANLGIGRGDWVVDLGCGDGNQLGVWSELVGGNGRVFGLDKSMNVLRAARQQSYRWPNVSFIQASMEEGLPFRQQSVTWVMAFFSIYYVESPEHTLTHIAETLTPGGKIVLVGPTSNNARSLCEFHLRATGRQIHAAARARSSRLQDAFLPLLGALFVDVNTTVLRNELVFPTTDQFVDYYMSTPLFRESGGTDAIRRSAIMQVATQMPKWTIDKETIVIEARRPW